jgi:excisionase family DNA binding protein
MEPLLDKNGLAELLNVKVSWVEEATAARSLPITWVGKHARYDRADITTWLAEKKERPAGAPVVGIFGPKGQARPRPTTPPQAPKPPAGPAKPKPPAGPRKTDGMAA